MAKFCEICGRGPLSAQTRSKSMIATKRRQKINLQTKTVEGKRVRVCTKCLRTISKKGAPITKAKPRVGLRTKKK